MGKGSKYCPCCNSFLSDESGDVIGFHAKNCPLAVVGNSSTSGWEMDKFTVPNFNFVTWYPVPPQNPAPTGWVCPKCGKVWAPSVRMCESCNPPYTITVWPPYDPVVVYPAVGTTTDGPCGTTPTDSQDEGKISCYLHSQ